MSYLPVRSIFMAMPLKADGLREAGRAPFIFLPFLKQRQPPLNMACPLLPGGRDSLRRRGAACWQLGDRGAAPCRHCHVTRGSWGMPAVTTCLACIFMLSRLGILLQDTTPAFRYPSFSLQALQQLFFLSPCLLHSVGGLCLHLPEAA